MNQEKISIIVPVYNIGNLVERTIKSICNQTYQNLEIIIVDDGSTDNTPSIIDELAKKDERIKVIHKQNGGVTSARLCGIENATGDYIGFCDGDDLVEPEMYEVLLQNAKKNNADISHCGYQMVFPSRVDLYYGTERLVEQDTVTGLNDLLSGAFVEPGLWNKLYNKSLFHSGKMDLSIKNFEDLLMNYYLFKESKKSVFYDKCFYHYMIREGSAATGNISAKKLTDPIKVFKIIRDDLGQNDVLLKAINGRLISGLVSLSTTRCGKNKEVIKPVRTNARRELKKELANLKKYDYSKKFKLRSYFAAYMPSLYGLVHRIYASVSGVNNKYKVT